MITGNKHGIK